MTRAATLFIVFFRALMVWRFFRYGDYASIILGFSECWALFSTLLGFHTKQVDSRRTSAVVPFLYCSPLLLAPVSSTERFWLFCLLFFMLCQLAIRAYMGLHVTVGVPFYRSLLDGGPYRYIRHPLALCEILIIGCYFLHSPSFWNLFWGYCCIYFAGAAVLIEERHLLTFAPYRDYVKRVPRRFIPGVL